MSFDYDIVVVGGGPGGYVAAIKAAQNGKKVCIIEEKHFGGTCLNEGCIPTKVYIKAAETLDTVKKANLFGVDGFRADNAKISIIELQKRKDSVINQLVQGVRGLLRMNKISVIDGFAEFVNEHTVTVNREHITGEYFIIATGSKAAIPSFIEVKDDRNIMTSTEVLSLMEIPESITIIGAGVIGIEFAHFFSHTNCKVTVLEYMDSILPMVDKEISGMVKKQMEGNGVEFLLESEVKSIDGNKILFKKDGEEKSIEADCILVATGREPFTDGLNAEAAGIEFEKKAIKTDETMRTNIPNIYAIGDVNGKSLLAHTASHEGLVAVNNICSSSMQKMDYNTIPACIYTEPEIASIGYTEEKAKEKFDDNIRIGRFPMVANGKTLIEGSSGGLFKVIVNSENDEVLGAHLYGVHATEMIGEIAAIMTNHIKAKEMLEVVHPHPSVNEAIGEMFLSACNGSAIHMK